MENEETPKISKTIRQRIMGIDRVKAYLFCRAMSIPEGYPTPPIEEIQKALSLTDDEVDALVGTLELATQLASGELLAESVIALDMYRMVESQNLAICFAAAGVAIAERDANYELHRVAEYASRLVEANAEQESEEEENQSE